MCLQKQSGPLSLHKEAAMDAKCYCPHFSWLQPVTPLLIVKNGGEAIPDLPTDFLWSLYLF